MTFNHEIIDKILEAIFPLPQNFGVIMAGDDDMEPDNYRELYKKVHSIDKDAVLNFGISKIVIIPSLETRVVIKIPFNGMYIEDLDTGALEWNDFSHANCTEDNSDYCLCEYKKYQILKDYNLDCFVAKTEFYKILNGFRIFIQETVIPNADIALVPKPSLKSTTIADTWAKRGEFSVDTNWIANCVDYYGESKVKRFLKYCEKDADILMDAHCGNYGYRNDDTPCILDYSNYLD